MNALPQLADVRSALREHLAAIYITVKTVREHEGEFTDKSIDALLMNTPALHVAVMGLKPMVPVASGGVAVTLKMAVFVVTRDAPGLMRDVAALNFAASLIVSLDRWQARGAGHFISQPAVNFSWQNLFAPQSQGKGVMLSALTFDSVVTLLRDASEPVLLDFQSLYLGEELILESPA